MNLYQQADEVHVELRSLALATSLKHHSFGLDIKTNQLASVYLHSFGVRLMVINQQKQDTDTIIHVYRRRTDVFEILLQIELLISPF